MSISKYIKDICNPLRQRKNSQGKIQMVLEEEGPSKECAVANMQYGIQHVQQDKFQTKLPWRTCKDAHMPSDAAIPLIGRYIKTQPSVNHKLIQYGEQALSQLPSMFTCG